MTSIDELNRFVYDLSLFEGILNADFIRGNLVELENKINKIERLESSNFMSVISMKL